MTWFKVTGELYLVESLPYREVVNIKGGQGSHGLLPQGFLLMESTQFSLLKNGGTAN